MHIHTHTGTHIYITLLVQTWELEYLEFRLMVFDFFFFPDCFVVLEILRSEERRVGKSTNGHNIVAPVVCWYVCTHI